MKAGRPVTKLVLYSVFMGCFGCGVFSNHSKPTDPSQLQASQGWIVLHHVPFVAQKKATLCGYAVTAMIHNYWRPSEGKSMRNIARRLPKEPDKGLAAKQLRDFFRRHAFDAYLIEGVPADLVRELKASRPIIVGTVYRQSDHYIAHYEVVAGINLLQKKNCHSRSTLRLESFRF